jgi:hypothetical protein
MPDRMLHRLAILVFVLLCAAGPALTLAGAWGRGDALSDVDAFSEANAVRGARGFLANGLSATAGLPNVLYGDLYPDQGFATQPIAQRTGVTADGVYTHYPPGPEYLAWLAMRLLGPEPVAHLRLLPALLSAGAMIWFGLAIRRRLGAMVAWVTIAACQAVPSFADASTFLHYDGYAFALLLVEVALALSANAMLPWFLLLGFLQGWLSFDYAFLVTLAPLSVRQVLPRLDDRPVVARRTALLRCGAVAVGFTAAHILHFAELCALFGGIGDAVHDLTGAALHRAGTHRFGSVLERASIMLGVVVSYVVEQVPAGPRAFRFLGLPLGLWWVVVAAALPLIQARLPRVSATLLNDWLVVSAWALLPGIVWYCVMIDHAIVHHHFLYRHLFLSFLLPWLFVAVRVHAWAAGPRITTVSVGMTERVGLG